MKVILIGDSCVDEYQYGTVERISPEAPVPVFKFAKSETRPGMGANVQKNLETFGFEVFPFLSPNSTKTRYIDMRSKQHMIRVDNDHAAEPLKYEDLPRFDADTIDAVVISDYNKGYVSYELVEQIRRNYTGPIFLDTKKQDLSRFDGCFVKINQVEYNNRHSRCKDLIVTLGAAGATYYSTSNSNVEEYFPTENVEVVDVCGAGDTFLSALVFSFVMSKDVRHSIRYANCAAGISVQHSGVYVLTQQDLYAVHDQLQKFTNLSP